MSIYLVTWSKYNVKFSPDKCRWNVLCSFHVYTRGSKVDDKQNAVSRTFRPSPRQPYCNVRGNNVDKLLFVSKRINLDISCAYW